MKVLMIASVLTLSSSAAMAQTPPNQPTENRKPSDNFLNEKRSEPPPIHRSAYHFLVNSVVSQLGPHWQPPSGPDVEAIVTTVRFSLNPDGSLDGQPSVIKQTGLNDTNRAQAAQHGQQAVRALQLAAPFDLPEEYYSAWKRVTLSFDWKLSQ